MDDQVRTLTRKDRRGAEMSDGIIKAEITATLSKEGAQFEDIYKMALEQENAKLREALEFYANAECGKNFQKENDLLVTALELIVEVDRRTRISTDQGRIATAALGGK